MYDDDYQKNGFFDDDIRIHKHMKAGTKRIIRISVVLVIMSLIFGFIYLNSMFDAPVTTSKEFITFVKDNNASEAYELFSTEAKKQIKEISFSKMVNQVSEVLTGEAVVTDRKLGSDSENSNSAKVICSIDGNDGLKYEVTVNLVKENGKWLVDDFTSESGPSKAGNSFIGFLQANDTASAYDQLTKNAQENMDSDGFKLEMDDLYLKIKNSEPALISKSGKKDSAQIVYALAGSDNKTYRISLDLTLSGDKWLISSYKIN